MRLIETSIKRPVGVTMIILAILALGFVSFRNLSVDLYPDIDLPIAVVATSYEGAAPQEVEELVTKPIESSVATIEGVETIQAQSQPGSSLVIMMFSTDTNLDNALLNVRESVDQIKGFLPTGANEPSVLRFDPQQMPVMWVGLTGADKATLQNVAENDIQPLFERQPGVGSVSIEGGVSEEVRVVLDQQRLNQFGLSSQQIMQSIQSANQSISGGVVSRGTQELQIRILGEYDSLDEIRQTLIQTPQNEFIRLNDVATVERAETEQTGLSLVNGEESVVMNILKKTDGNTVAVSDEIHSAMEDVRENLPEGVKLNTVFDTSQFIRMSIDSVVQNLLLGALFAVLVLLLFLKSFRATLVISLSIPIAVITTFTLMYFTGETVNVLTMGGLALGIGMMVDSAIVILEHIVTYRERGYSMIEAAKEGASEIAPAVIASTTTTLVVFLPIVFVEGIASEIFTPLAITVAFALIASLAASLTIIPMLSSKMLKKLSAGNGRRYWFDRLLDGVIRVYQGLLRGALRFRKTTILVTFIVIASSLALIPRLGLAFIPEADQGQIEITVTTPSGTNLETTSDVVDRVNTIMEKDEDVIESSYVSVGGGGSMGMGMTANTASYMIQLVPQDERDLTTEDVMQKWDSQVQDIAGADISVNVLGAGISTGDPVQIQLQGPDHDVLSQIADQVVTVISDVEGVHNAGSSTDEGRPEMQIVVDREAAAEFGMTYQQVMGQVSSQLNGQIATQFRTGGNELDVRVLTPKEERDTIEEIENLKIMTPTGEQIRLETVASLEQVRGPVTLTRSNQQRQVVVSSGLVGRDLGSVMTDIEDRLSGMEFPEGYSYSIGGQAEDMMEAFGDLALALVFSIFLVYAVMAVQFENFLHPFIIMFSLPTMVIGVILGLFVTGLPLSIPAFIGVIMLAGIVVNNAIVLVDYINILRRKGTERFEAILEAGGNRLRPILMTSLTTVLGMIPLSLGLGQGGEAQQPLAVVIIFGLMFSMLITLVLIPVVYTLFDDLSRKILRKS
ncbi:efflux RND transporter permease subunit [Tenuibacillus multivorans]|uniref:Hydrophobic/amphiphilic exporter-1, HAE1 family n=1 Tax=Tenuibacillus multivorans TaxID=237069 RepID=A0A1G9X5B9_9BACI|nr:efflux RND transporter permease subunit [Tenuibacillus multivorans]GEL77221.1 multidrug ABC transporter [Tenuibacillus multivorans]SDM91887.1 hydrophobic/amphiphilic exporter-1, HAE1 family [Tenuibacillus multivorans]